MSSSPESDGPPAKKQKITRSTPRKTVKEGGPKGTPKGTHKGNLPTTMDEADFADQQLLRDKADGKPWADITNAYIANSGQQMTKNAVMKRYGRLHANLQVWPEGHVCVSHS
jgi:hypothetical protein